MGKKGVGKKGEGRKRRGGEGRKTDSERREGEKGNDMYEEVRGWEERGRQGSSFGTKNPTKTQI